MPLILANIVPPAPPTMSVADQALSFGRLTLAGSAGNALGDLVATNGTPTSITLGTRTVGSDHFVGGSTLVTKAVPTDAQYVWTGCTASGASGTSGAFTLTINTVANAYSVANTADLASVWNLDATLSGKTVLMRYNGGAIYTFPNVYGGQKSYSSLLTYESHDHSRLATVAGFATLTGGSGTCNNIKFYYVGFYLAFLTSWNAMVVLSNGSDITFDHCFFNSDLPAARLAPDYTTALGSGNPQKFFIQCDTGQFVTNLTITNNLFTNGCSAIGVGGTNVVITDNIMHDNWGDFIQLQCPTTGFTVKNNQMYNSNCWAEAVHPDFFQIGDGTGLQQSIVASDGLIAGNRRWIGREGELQVVDSHGGFGDQGVLVQNMEFRRCRIVGNVFALNAQAGLSFDQHSRVEDCYIGYNTIVRDWQTPATDPGFPSFPAPVIGIQTADAKTVIEHNVTEGISELSGLATLRNNYTSITRTAISSYQNVFAGTTFDPTTQADLLAEFLMDANGALDANNSGAWDAGDIGALGTSVTNGFWNFTTGLPNDTTAPVLTSVGATASGDTTADIAYTTDEGYGTAYWVLSTSATAPTAAQVRQGLMHTGSAAAANGYKHIAASGAQTGAATGLTAGTTYYLHVTQYDPSGNVANVVTSASITTGSACTVIGATANLKLHLDGTNNSTTFTDSSSAVHTFTAVGNAKLSTAQKKFGTASLLCDGSGDSIKGDGGSGVTFGAGDFTISLWVYVNNYPGSFAVLVDLGDGNTAPQIYLDSAGKLNLYEENGTRITSAAAVGTGGWKYIGWSRSGTDEKLFVDGAQVGSTYTSGLTFTIAANGPAIGGKIDGSLSFDGYVDEVLFVKGTALTLTSVPTTAWC